MFAAMQGTDDPAFIVVINLLEQYGFLGTPIRSVMKGRKEK
jgi:hypothetical protein